MTESNKSRWQWLNTRNPDLINEIHWRVQKLVDGTQDGPADSVFTVPFEVTFNTSNEFHVFQRYVESEGFKFELLMSISDSDKFLTYSIRIGL